MKQKILNILFSIFFWNFIAILFVILRSYGLEEVLDVEPLNFYSLLPQLISSGTFFGIVFYIIDTNFYKIIKKKTSYFILVLLKSLLNLSFLAISSIIFNLFESLFTGNSISEFAGILTESLINNKLNTLVIFIYFSIVFTLHNAFQQFNKRFGPGILLNIFLGKYHQPREVTKIFMFLDLTDSTKIAEKLGHINYSKLLQTCFEDLGDIVLKYKAEIYQYVGDGVVLTWNLRDGFNKNNCFHFYFSFVEYINKYNEKYLTNFELVPKFKAGLNMGIVTITEIGKIKREIAYHGEAINTASRIQDKCNEFNENVLISENLQIKLNNDQQLQTILMGKIPLKGKQNPIKIFSISKII